MLSIRDAHKSIDSDRHTRRTIQGVGEAGVRARHRHISISISTAVLASTLAFCVGAAYPLDLGEPDAQSALGRPLRLSIPMTGDQVRNVSARCIKVKLVSLEDTLIVAPKVRVSHYRGSAEMLLTTYKKITEPALTVSIRSICGPQLQRDYQILLDLPANARQTAEGPPVVIGAAGTELAESPSSRYHAGNKSHQVRNAKKPHWPKSQQSQRADATVQIDRSEAIPRLVRVAKLPGNALKLRGPTVLPLDLHSPGGLRLMLSVRLDLPVSWVEDGPHGVAASIAARAKTNVSEAAATRRTEMAALDTAISERQSQLLALQRRIEELEAKRVKTEVVATAETPQPTETPPPTETGADSAPPPPAPEAGRDSAPQTPEARQDSTPQSVEAAADPAQPTLEPRARTNRWFWTFFGFLIVSLIIKYWAELPMQQAEARESKPQGKPRRTGHSTIGEPSMFYFDHDIAGIKVEEHLEGELPSAMAFVPVPAKAFTPPAAAATALEVEATEADRPIPVLIAETATNVDLFEENIEVFEALPFEEVVVAPVSDPLNELISGWKSHDVATGAEMPKVSELTDVMNQAEFWVSVNKLESAAQVLEQFGDVDRPRSPLIWLYLFDLYKKLDSREKYDSLRRRFHRTFNAKVPAWKELSIQKSTQGLEELPLLLEKITSLWHSEDSIPFLESLLVDDRDGTRQGFELAVYCDILFLIDIAHALNANSEYVAMSTMFKLGP